jgi:hypothetical protein
VDTAALDEPSPFPYIRTVEDFRVGDHFRLRTDFQGACRHEDHPIPISRRIRERLSRPARERS